MTASSKTKAEYIAKMKAAMDAYDKLSHGDRRAIVEGWLFAKIIAENPGMVRAHIEALLDIVE